MCVRQLPEKFDSSKPSPIQRRIYFETNRQINRLKDDSVDKRIGKIIGKILNFTSALERPDFLRNSKHIKSSVDFNEVFVGPARNQRSVQF